MTKPFYLSVLSPKLHLLFFFFFYTHTHTFNALSQHLSHPPYFSFPLFPLDFLSRAESCATVHASPVGCFMSHGVSVKHTTGFKSLLCGAPPSHNDSNDALLLFLRSFNDTIIQKPASGKRRHVGGGPFSRTVSCFNAPWCACSSELVNFCASC